MLQLTKILLNEIQKKCMVAVPHCDVTYLSGEEEDSHTLPPLFLTEFDLDLHQLSFIPNVENFHDIIGDVIGQ